MVRVKVRYITSQVSVKWTKDQMQIIPGSELNVDDYEDSLSQKYRSLAANEITYNIKQACRSAFGIIGQGKMMTNFKVVYWNLQTGLLIVQCLRDEVYDMMKTLFTSISSVTINKKVYPALVDIIHCSGSVRGCQKFLIRFYRRELLRNPHLPISALKKAISRDSSDRNIPQIISN